jgi:outer membrane protein OmpA-like peptidoglycan-associated protein
MKSVFVLAAALGAATTAHADRWMTVELPSAFAVSQMQEEVFRPGAMPAAGGYISHGRFALGLRLRAGLLRNGGQAPGNLMEPGDGGLLAGGLAARVMVGGGFVELVGGGGITGRDVVPELELGIGWFVDVGSFDVGPSLRYVRVVASQADMLGNANLVLAGIDFRFGKSHERVPVLPPSTEPAPLAWGPPPAPPAEPAHVDSDGDRIADHLASCEDILEFLDEDSACGPEGVVEVEGDRIILEERVLFDTDHAHVKSQGREIIRAIAKAAAQHPEWVHITIEGHADVRGPDDYNQALSERRAEMTRNVLVKAGVDPDRVGFVGYGRTRPRDPGVTPEAHARNRRVEFVIDRAPHTEEVQP